MRQLGKGHLTVNGKIGMDETTGVRTHLTVNGKRGMDEITRVRTSDCQWQNRDG